MASVTQAELNHPILIYVSPWSPIVLFGHLFEAYYLVTTINYSEKPVKLVGDFNLDLLTGPENKGFLKNKGIFLIDPF